MKIEVPTTSMYDKWLLSFDHNDDLIEYFTNLKDELEYYDFEDDLEFQEWTFTKGKNCIFLKENTPTLGFYPDKLKKFCEHVISYGYILSRIDRVSASKLIMKVNEQDIQIF